MLCSFPVEQSSKSLKHPQQNIIAVLSVDVHESWKLEILKALDSHPGKGLRELP